VSPKEKEWRKQRFLTITFAGMLFSEVIGQSVLKKELPALLRENRLAHAILFWGKEGAGALPLALAFARYAMCERKLFNQSGSGSGRSAAPGLFGEGIQQIDQTAVPDGDACGVCPSCLKSADWMHPDIHFSYPVVPKKPGTPPVSTDYIGEWREFLRKNAYGNAYDWLQFIGAENKQGNITAAECNDIIRKLNFKSFEGGLKILVMWMPEYLGNEGNKLLKLIEEPPENTLFLLISENENMILPTILSRCQLIKVPSPEDSEIKDALIERQKMEPQRAARIAAIAEGNFREALQMARQTGEDMYTLLRDWMNAIVSKSTGPTAQVRWVDEIGKLGREEQKQFLRYFNHILQLSIRMWIDSNAGEKHPESESEFARKLHQFTSLEQQQAIVEELDQAAYYIERNAHGRMLFMALTIKIKHIIRDNIVFLNQ
jgi:DNA polymerase-3 subunit delta'